MKKRILTGIIALLLLLPLTGCGSKPTTDPGSSFVIPTDKTVLNVASMVDPEGLDPQKTSATSTYEVTTNIFESLVTYDENWNVQPRLAKDWTVAEDCMSITFKLRDDVKFHNGRQMTAEDVKFSIERLHEDDSPKKKYYKNIVDCVIEDDFTITFKTETPDPVLLTSFAYPWSVVVPKECVDTLKTNPVGTGCFKFVEWTPQQDLKLTANEDYYDGAPKIANVHFQIVPDATTAMVGIMDGSFDLVEVSGYSVDPIKDNKGVSIYSKGVNAVAVLGMNLDNEYLKNEKVRQAMASAIDKDEIINATSDGFGDKVGSYLPSSAAEYIDTNDVMPYDLEKAKTLLAEAGYPDGFSIGLTLPKDYATYTNIGQVIADQLEKINVHCKIEMVEWAEWMQNVYTDKKYDMTVMANTGRLSAYDFISRFNSASGDYISFKTGEADEILAKLKTELDETERVKLVQEFQMLIAEKVPVVPIESQLRLYAMNASLKGFAVYPTETTDYKYLYFE